MASSAIPSFPFAHLAAPTAPAAAATHADVIKPVEAASLTKFLEVVGDLAINLFIAFLILVATFFLARWVSNEVRVLLKKLRGTRHDQTLQEFGAQVVRWAIFIVGLIAVLRRLGVETTSIIAMLGAASLAIGLALQGTLANVAAGVMLLLLRPYRIGESVQIGGQKGKVQRLDLFTTEIITPENTIVVMPNSKALGDQIINETHNPTRRADIDLGVGYGDDLDHAFRTVLNAVVADERVLKEPAPWVGVLSFGDNQVNLRLQAWTASVSYWKTSADLRKAIKEAFDREGITMPYPHQVSLTPEQAGEIRSTPAQADASTPPVQNQDPTQG